VGVGGFFAYTHVVLRDMGGNGSGSGVVAAAANRDDGMVTDITTATGLGRLNISYFLVFHFFKGEKKTY
jgi:hypothetical protein